MWQRLPQCPIGQDTRYEGRLKDSQRVKGNGEANGGDDGNRTHDLLLAKQALYQLSYVPVFTARSGYRDKTERQG